MTDSPPEEGRGFRNKPRVEQLKLVALFVLICALVYLSRPIWPLWSAGAAFALVGALVRIWAAGHLTRDQRLSVSGPYAYTRNPFYLGRLFVLLGVALMSGLQNRLVWLILVGAVAFFFFVYMPRKERREGGRLEHLFGEQFRSYRQSVPALLPRLTPYRDPFTSQKRAWNRNLFFAGDGQFSGNKELPTALGTLLLIGLFLARLLLLHT